MAIKIASDEIPLTNAGQIIKYTASYAMGAQWTSIASMKVENRHYVYFYDKMLVMELFIRSLLRESFQQE